MRRATPVHRAAAAPPPDEDLLATLDSGNAVPEPPIRSVLFGPARFEEHGRSLAASHEVDRAGAASAAFFPRLRDNVRMLRRARLLLEAEIQRLQASPHATHSTLSNLDHWAAGLRRHMSAPPIPSSPSDPPTHTRPGPGLDPQ